MFKVVDDERPADDAASCASDARALAAFESSFVYKVGDGDGRVHRFVASDESLAAVANEVAARLGAADAAALSLEYDDDDGDAVVLVDDANLADAVAFARSAGLPALKLRATARKRGPPKAVRAAVAAAASGLGLLGLLLLKKRA